MKKLVAIDGNSIMNRAFYGIMNSKLLMTSDGIYTNAIFGFLSILLKLLNDENPDYVCVAFDLKAPTFRHKKYDGYKATRKGMPDELRMQMPIIKDVLRAMNIKILEIEGYEADDILGTLAKYGEDNGIEVLLLTGDRDALQLVSDNVTVRIPTTRMGKTESTDYTPAVVSEKFGIVPKEFIETKSLMGDSSDNIPGVPGVGEKTAFSLITKYHNIDTIYEALESGKELEGIKGKLKEKILANKELAYLSKELGTIYREVPIEINEDEISKKDFNDEELYNLFLKLQLKSFIDKLELKEGKVEESSQEIDSPLTVKSFDELVLDGVSEFAYYWNDDGLALYLNDVAYYVKKPQNDQLKKVFENNILKIGYEEKGDYLKLKYRDIEAKNMMFDITIAAYLLNPAKSTYKLNDLILEELNILVDEEEQNTQLSFDAFNSVDDGKIQEKICKYAKYIYRCKEKYEEALKQREEYKLFNEIEMPLMRVLAAMEYTGVLVDSDMLKEYSIVLNKKVDELTKEIWDLAQTEFNVNSPKQLGEVLFEKLNLPVIKKTKNGYSTDSEVLEKLAPEHPIIDKILEYRVMSKLKATYVDGMIGLINPDTHRIHAKFNQTVTATGRISCTEPNLQNIPIRTELGRELRKVFIAREGYVLLDADYSQVELRVLANMSGDKTMIKAFNSGVDIHAVTASQVFNVPIEEVTKQMRGEAKAVNFGIVYGISDYGLATNIKTSRKKAKEYIEKYFETYPKIKEYMDNSISSCKEKGYVETLWGRRRYVPEIKSNNYNVRQFGERVAMNAPIQGTAADIIKIAMVNIENELEERKLQSKLILQVHDELVIETKQEELDVVKELLIRNMQNVVKMSVPLQVDANYGKTWFDAH
jgi:DNA polymerase-1